MRAIASVFLCVCACLLAGCKEAAPPRERLASDHPWFATLAATTAAEAVRIESSPPHAPVGEPIRLTDAQLAELRRVLGPGRIGELPYKCEVTPGVRLTLRAGDRATDVLVCLECTSITVAPETWLPVKPDADLIAFVKQLFPSDPAIQAF